MMMVTVPAVNGVGAALKLPLVSVTDPVGVGALAPPLTVTVTDSGWAVVMLESAGVTITVGITSCPLTESELDTLEL
jgi:hypothetical protein